MHFLDDSDSDSLATTVRAHCDPAQTKLPLFKMEIGFSAFVLTMSAVYNHLKASNQMGPTLKNKK